MAVEPNLIASREYSTWKRRPSGEKVLLGLLGAGSLKGSKGDYTLCHGLQKILAAR